MTASLTGVLFKAVPKKLSPEKYERRLLQEIASLKINLNAEVIYLHNGFIEEALSAIINLALVGFWCSLGNQYIDGKCLLYL